MDFNTFKAGIDLLSDYVFLIILWDWGEPFINPQIYDMIKYAKSKGIQILSSTNGHYFAKKENAEKLIDSGIDSIIVAIDGITQDTYQQFRDSGNLEQALQGIRNLVDYKRAQQSQNPIINFRFIVTRNNEHEIEDVKRLAFSLGVDALTFKTLNPYEIYAEHESDKKMSYQNLIPEDKKYQRFEYRTSGGIKSRIKRKPTCTRFWDCLSIRWDGEVCICTYDYKNKYLFGNINKNSIRDIWSTGLHRSIRRKFKSNWEGIEICRNCTNAYVGGSCKGETIRAVYYNPEVAELFRDPEQPAKVKPLNGVES